MIAIYNTCFDGSNCDGALIKLLCVYVQCQIGHALAQGQRNQGQPKIHKQSLRSQFLKDDTTWFHIGSGSSYFSNTHYMTSFAELALSNALRFPKIQENQRQPDLQAFLSYFNLGFSKKDNKEP